MFVDVDFFVKLPECIAVPADAVVDYGLFKRVFVDHGNSSFEAREVETGWRLGDKIGITRGLVEGERVVASGAFLIDSESRMKTEAKDFVSMPVKDSVCGMDINETQSRSEGKVSTFEGKPYFFFSHPCKQKFDKDPSKYTANHHL